MEHAECNPATSSTHAKLTKKVRAAAKLARELISCAGSERTQDVVALVLTRVYASSVPMDIISMRSRRLTSRDKSAARKPDTTQATAGVSVYEDTLAKNLRAITHTHTSAHLQKVPPEGRKQEII